MEFCFHLDISVPHVQPSRLVRPRRSVSQRFECPLCEKVFRRREHQVRHVRTQHKGEKPHVCSVASCQKRYTRREELLKHFRIHHGPDSRSSTQDKELQRTRVLLPRPDVSTIDLDQMSTSDATEPTSPQPMMLGSDHSSRNSTTSSTPSSPPQIELNYPSEGVDDSPCGKTQDVAVSEILQVQATQAILSSRSSLEAAIQEVSHTTSIAGQTPSLDENDTHNLLALASLAHQCEPIPVTSVRVSKMCGIQSFSPPRRLPISSLLISTGPSIRDIFNGYSRDLPLPVPP